MPKRHDVLAGRYGRGLQDGAAVHRQVEHASVFGQGAQQPRLAHDHGHRDRLAGPLRDEQRLSGVEGELAQDDPGAHFGLLVQVDRVAVIAIEAHGGKHGSRPHRGLCDLAAEGQALQSRVRQRLGSHGEGHDPALHRLGGEGVEARLEVPHAAAALHGRRLVALRAPGEERLDPRAGLGAFEQHLVTARFLHPQEQGERGEQVGASGERGLAVQLDHLLAQGLAVAPAHEERRHVHRVLRVPRVDGRDPVAAVGAEGVDVALVEVLEEVGLAGFRLDGDDPVGQEGAGLQRRLRVLGRWQVDLGHRRQALLRDLSGFRRCAEGLVGIEGAGPEGRGARLGKLEAEVGGRPRHEEPVDAERAGHHPLPARLGQPGQTEAQVQRVSVALLGPGLPGAAVRGDQVETGIELSGETTGEKGLAHLRLHTFRHRVRVDQPLPALPHPQVGEVSARGLQPHPPPLLHHEPVGTLLEVVEGAADELRLHELRGLWHRPLGEAAHGEPGLALGPGVALGQHPVLTALEEHVEAAVPFARATRRFARSGHAVDDLHGSARGALRENGVAAEPADGQEGALPPGRGQGLSIEDGIAVGRDERKRERDQEQTSPQGNSTHVRGSFLSGSG